MTTNLPLSQIVAVVISVIATAAPLFAMAAAIVVILLWRHLLVMVGVNHMSQAIIPSGCAVDKIVIVEWKH